MPEKIMKRCYCDEMIECNSTLRNAIDATEHSRAFSSFGSAASLASTKVHIPIVFQIVGKQSVQDAITTERLESQVAQLNADFLGVNLDIVNTPGAFASRLSLKDERISFSIADTIRTVTDVDRYTMGFGPGGWDICNQTMKYSALGGADPVDQFNRLNVWICNFSTDGGEQLDVLGYSWFPEWVQEGGCAAHSDGIVQLPGTIGSTLMPGGYASIGYGTGRTLTHEVGHYLSLRHIWYDCGPFVCCGGLDMPRQLGPNRGRPSHPHRAGLCPDANGTASPGDMFMNYMDYVDDVFMIALTKQQMDAAVQSCVTYRNGFLVSGDGPGPNPPPLKAPVINNLTVEDEAFGIDVRVSGLATFNGLASFSGRMVGNAEFNGTSTNNGVIIGDATFNDESSNLGTVTGSVTCNTTGTCT